MRVGGISWLNRHHASGRSHFQKAQFCPAWEANHRLELFLTSDKGDISSKRFEIEALLAIKVLHFQDHWDDFLSLVKNSS